MAVTVYILCTLTSALCAVLLFREYRRSEVALLLWSALSFGALALSNALVFLDLVVWPTADLAIARSGCFVAATGLLIYGLVWDVE